MIKSINYKKKIAALTCLIAAVVLIYIKSTSTKLIQIQGKVEIKIGNHMPSTDTSPNEKNIQYIKVQIIAIPGRVKHLGQKSIPIENIPPNAIVKETNSRGEFTIALISGKYTFFILKNNEAYKNNFDGSGFFTQTKINKNTEDLVLTYDKFAVY